MAGLRAYLSFATRVKARRKKNIRSIRSLKEKRIFVDSKDKGDDTYSQRNDEENGVR